ESERAEHGHVVKSGCGNGAQSPGDSGEANGDRDRAAPVETLPLGIAAFAGKAGRECRGGGSQRYVEQEDRAPRDLIDQPATEHGADRGRQRADTGPYPDRMAALVVVEGRPKHRKTRRREQRGTETLDRAADDERRDVWRK